MNVINRAVFVYRVDMGFCSISFVLGESVFRILLIKLIHISVTAYFGEDGCCSDVKALGISFDHGNDLFVLHV